MIYRGPYSEVYDDEGHVYPRGQRIATCARSFDLMTSGVYKDDFIGITPAELKPAVNWCAPAGTIRPAGETKGASHTGMESAGNCC